MYPVLRTIVVVVLIVVWLAANDKHRSNTCVHSQQRAGRVRGRGGGGCVSIAVTARHINSNGLSASPTLGVAYKLANL